jgi:hypothetical protein
MPIIGMLFTNGTGCSKMSAKYRRVVHGQARPEESEHHA